MLQAVPKEEEWFFKNFNDLEKNRRTESAVHLIRREAFSRFTDLGFPTTRNEDWIYTNCAPIAKGNFSLSFQSPQIPVTAIERYWIPGKSGLRLAFINGHFNPAFSSLQDLPKGVEVSSLAAVLDEQAVLDKITRVALFDQQAFVALNTAFMQDGAFIRIAKGVAYPNPIQLLFISTGNALAHHPRNLIALEEGSEAQVIETYVGLSDEAYFTNPVTEVVLGENAILDHVKIQAESESAFHVAGIHVQQARASDFRSHSFSYGGGLVRNDLQIVLQGEGTQSHMNGLYIASGNQLVDNHTLIDHAKPHCSSDELYKGILSGKSRGVFNGKIIVRPDAQKTNALQSNRNLLLSGEATIDTKPELQIHADDVKCTHGATIGQLDDEAVFYLRSRGIGKDAVMKMLIHAFASDLVDRVKEENVKKYLDETLLQVLTKKKLL